MRKKLLLSLLALLVLCLACGVAAAEECSHAETHWEHNVSQHWEICDLCGKTVNGPQGHAARCTEPGVCLDCGAPYTGDNKMHGELVIKYNETEHWLVCGDCGWVNSYRRGVHYANCDKPGVCGYCGVPYTGSNVGHAESTVMYNEEEHWWVCKQCETVTSGPEPHAAQCNELNVCAACRMPYTGSNVRHTIPVMAYNEEGHWIVCESCGEKMEEFQIPFEHVASCVAPGVCSMCGAPYTGSNVTHEVAHKYDAETCWDVCLYCGEMLSEPKPHEASPADPTVCRWCDSPMPESGEKVLRVIYDRNLGMLVTPDDPTYTGFVDFEGGKFYLKNGQQATDFVAPVEIDGIFYAFEHGRVQMENLMTAFEGGLFAFNGGTLRTDLTGLAEYNGEKFVFSQGQYQRSANGPYLDPISGKWVYVNEGQFYPITDLITYEGEIFYFIDGILASDYTRIAYDFNGTGFYIASGQHYKITDLVSCSNGEVLYVVDGRFASWYTGVVKDFQGVELNVVDGKVVQ